MVTLWPVLCFVAWGAPAVIVAVLLISKAGSGDLDGRATDAIRLCLLVFCLTGELSKRLEGGRTG